MNFGTPGTLDNAIKKARKFEKTLGKRDNERVSNQSNKRKNEDFQNRSVSYTNNMRFKIGVCQIPTK